MSGVSSSSSAVGDTQESSRVARTKPLSACDTCRRRKLKCSGLQPCERCVSSGVNCTYGSMASRSSSLAYTRHLEARIAELQNLLLQQQPFVGTTDQSSASDSQVESLVNSGDDFVYLSTDSEVETFHGRFAALSLLRMVRELCDSVAGGPSNQSGRVLAAAFDSNLLNVPLTNEMAYLAILPPLENTTDLVGLALDDALCCQEFMDRPRLHSQIQRLYDLDPEDYTQSDRRALSLVYALLALGRQRSIDSAPPNPSADAVFMRGLKYFHASRAVIDAVDNNDLDSIRAIICCANYLMSASMASKAYAAISIAVGAALRMGLHIYSPAFREQFSAHELTQRRQVFASLNFTQTYLSSMLGMPMLLQSVDPEQLLPLPEADVHDDGKRLVAAQPTSPASNSVLLCKLGRILAEVVQGHFSEHRKARWQRPSTGSLANYDQMERWERELQEWHQDLPSIPPNAMDQNVLRAQLMLRFVDASVRTAIYRPFIQHVVRNRQDPDFSQKGFECGSASLKASMQAIWLADTMNREGVLSHAQWYVIYNLAIGACSLSLFAISSTEDPTVEEVRAAAEKAKELLEILSQRSVGARRCLESLNALHQKIAESRGSSASPRTQFMEAIGAMDFRA